MSERNDQPYPAPFHMLPVEQRVAAIRYSLNWQGIALRLQYGRLKEHHYALGDLTSLNGTEYMSNVVDMDFLVIVVRRILRMANQAKSSGLDVKKRLKPLIRDFENQWRHIIDARNTLENIDEPRTFRALVPYQSSAGESGFLMPGKSIDAHQLFADTENLCKAVADIIRPHES